MRQALYLASHLWNSTRPFFHRTQQWFSASRANSSLGFAGPFRHPDRVRTPLDSSVLTTLPYADPSYFRSKTKRALTVASLRRSPASSKILYICASDYEKAPRCRTVSHLPCATSVNVVLNPSSPCVAAFLHFVYKLTNPNIDTSPPRNYASCVEIAVHTGFSSVRSWCAPSNKVRTG